MLVWDILSLSILLFIFIILWIGLLLQYNLYLIFKKLVLVILLWEQFNECILLNSKLDILLYDIFSFLTLFILMLVK